MKYVILFSCALLTFMGCKEKGSKKISEVKSTQKISKQDSISLSLANQVSYEMGRSWEGYKKYAWGDDVLKPISKSSENWYEEPLYISPIDAYSTLHLMGMKEEAKEIENYVVDSLDFNKNINAKIFEVNIRILGGLLAMYELSGNEKVLDKTVDFADRILPAFDTKTGIPTYWVNLKTREKSGDTVNVAEAATYTFEMGMLSYYTKDPKYYQAGKKATLAVYNLRNKNTGLIGDVLDVEQGIWTGTNSHICAGVDSYYEYLYKSYLMFGDPELGEIWDETLPLIMKYNAETFEDNLYFKRVNMNTGEETSTVMTLYDAFFPATLALAGEMETAEKYQKTWDHIWNLNGLEPVVWDYKKKVSTYPVYDLNPEIIESAYYLYHYTGDRKYLDMVKQYWSDILEYCKDDVAFHAIQDVTTKEPRDQMPTFFLAETLKYFYLAFTEDGVHKDFLENHIFNTEAHQFKRNAIDKTEAKKRLGF